MLRNAGFKIITKDEKIKRAMTDKELSAINTQKHVTAVDNDDEQTMARNAYEQVNELLQLPDAVAKDNPELFTKNSRLQQHFNICKYVQVDEAELNNRMHMKDSFKILKLRSNENKIKTYKEMQQAFTCADSLDNISIPENIEQLYLNYKNVIGSRLKTVYDFTKIQDVRNCMVSIGQSLFGYSFYKKVGQDKKDSYMNGKRIRKLTAIYDYDIEFIQHNTDLSKYRHGDMRDKDGLQKPTIDYAKILDSM